MPTAEAVPTSTTPPVGAGLLSVAIAWAEKSQCVMSVSAPNTVIVAALVVAVETKLVNTARYW